MQLNKVKGTEPYFGGIGSSQFWGSHRREDIGCSRLVCDYSEVMFVTNVTEQRIASTIKVEISMKMKAKHTFEALVTTYRSTR
jgi:hypothetical protein